MKLKFYAKGTAMVPDLDAQERGIKKFVGRRFDATLGEEFKNPDTGETVKSGGWVPTEQPSEVDYRYEYVRECLAGCLEPADEVTAKACGLAWTADKP